MYVCMYDLPSPPLPPLFSEGLDPPLRWNNGRLLSVSVRDRRVGNGAAILDSNNLVSRAFSLENGREKLGERGRDLSVPGVALICFAASPRIV